MSKVTITNKGETPFAAEMWGAFVDLKPGVATEIVNPFKAGPHASASNETFALALLQAYPHRDLVLERESDGATVSMAVPTKLGNVQGGPAQIGELPVAAPEPVATVPPPPAAAPAPAKAATKPAAKPKGKGK